MPRRKRIERPCFFEVVQKPVAYLFRQLHLPDFARARFYMGLPVAGKGYTQADRVR